MNWNDLEKHFSTARLDRYRSRHQGDLAKAAADYARNMSLSEAMMPLLSVLEISLRNGIHTQLTALYKREDWWAEWAGKPLFEPEIGQIESAKRALKKRREPTTPDKIVAELTFGFWNSLFNARLGNELWKSLRMVFPRCPKEQRQRADISRALHSIRKLRNRVFHHEPVIWLTPSAHEHHQLGLQVVGWINPQLATWVTQFDRFPGLWLRKQ